MTYATVGDKFGYWDFPPSDEPSEWGRVPAIGWATIQESKVSSISSGGRYFGWQPMSQYLSVAAVPRYNGFRDCGHHRSKHAYVYVDFVRTDLDPYYVDSSVDGEDRQALLRGLFITAFLADEFLKDMNYFDAKSIVIVSASRKTALGLSQRLQSKKSITSISGHNKAIVIDMSGNRPVIELIHKHLQNKIQYSMAIGFSHHNTHSAPLGGLVLDCEPKLFFAPSDLIRRSKEWGHDGYEQRARTALETFLHSSHRWMDINRVIGPNDVQSAWKRLYRGELSPKSGLMASM